MYHCHIHFYLVGKALSIFEIIKEMKPLAYFTHTFWESEEPDPALAEKADVILADLQAVKGQRELELFMQNKPEKAELIFLGGADSFTRVGKYLENTADVWITPMGEEEIRFRFLQWQKTCKMSRDFWQTSQYLEATINHIPNLVWFKDKNGIHEKVNDSFCRTVNKSKKQVEGDRKSTRLNSSHV